LSGTLTAGSAAIEVKMSVKVHILPYLQYLTGGKTEVEVAGGTVAECLDDLTRQFPGTRTVLLDDNGALLDYVNIYVNGKSSYHEGLTKQVREGDELLIVLLIEGG
jgi:molybdopterin synthase sulfur carrier subunit